MGQTEERRWRAATEVDWENTGKTENELRVGWAEKRSCLPEGSEQERACNGREIDNRRG